MFCHERDVKNRYISMFDWDSTREEVAEECVDPDQELHAALLVAMQSCTKIAS